MRMFIFALEHGQGWKVQRRTHKQTERRSCRLILPSPMLLWSSLAALKLPSTYSRTHSAMKEEQSAGEAQYNARHARQFVAAQSNRGATEGRVLVRMAASGRR